MTRTEAKRLAKSIKRSLDKLPKDAGRGMESKTWDLALETLLAWAREATADVKLSRDLLALSSFLTVGGDGRREELYRQACADPLLALECVECGSDQDAYGTTCDENKKHYDACAGCGVCPDCDGRETWVRPRGPTP